MKKNEAHYIKFPLLIALSCMITIFCGLFSDVQTAGAAATTLSATSKTIYVNGTYNITVKNKKSKSTLFYTSHDTKVAKVNKKGTVTGLNKGVARITVRYKKSGRYYKVGTFKITVKKATLNTTYKVVNSTVGDKLSADQYLNNINANATYSITSTKNSVAAGNSSGEITILKAGTATLTISEVYNKKTRKLGTISITAIGASMKSTATKMGYSSSLSAYDFIDDRNINANYTFTSNSPALVDTKTSIFKSCANLNSTQSCTVTFYEVIKNVSREIGKLEITVTNSAFLLPENQTFSMGLGATLSIGGNEGFILTNRDFTKTYTLKPEDNTVINDKLIAVKYGTTTVTINEVNPKDNSVKTIAEKLTVTVAPASISPELKEGGFNTRINGDQFGRYPIINRNHNVLYFYEAADQTICSVSAGGSDPNQDYLVIRPLKVGDTTITVSEMDPLNGNKKKRIGLFKVHVEAEDTSITPVIRSAADVISTITYTHNNKIYTGNISNTSLLCEFIDKNRNGLIDYGTDFSSLTQGGFNIVLKRQTYSYTIEKVNNYNWNIVVSLGDANKTTVKVPVTMAAAKLDISKVISQIRVSLGNDAKTITSETKLPQSNNLQLSGNNTSYKVQFTAKQFIDAGATEYDPNAAVKVPLKDLKNVSCSVTQNAYTNTNKDANTAIKSISQPVSTDNANWTFTITFEDNMVLNCSVSVGLEQ